MEFFEISYDYNFSTFQFQNILDTKINFIFTFTN
jgi:hypothetical protein